MKINIKGTGIELTEALTNYVDQVLESVEKIIPDNVDPIVQVEIGKISNHHKSGEIFRAEINIEIDGVLLTAREEMEDLYAAIYAVKEHIIVEIKKMKSKKQSLMRRGGQKIKNILKGAFGKN